jgi:hypothetical protein
VTAPGEVKYKDRDSFEPDRTTNGGKENKDYNSNENYLITRILYNI